MAKKKKKDENIKKDIYRMIEILLVVLLVLALFYLLTLKITNKKVTKTNSSSDKTQINYQDILIGNSFNLSDDNYVIIYYDKSDDKLKSNMSSLISNYENNSDHLPVYIVDMSKSYNKKYANRGNNNNPTSVDDLSINDTTLIKFENKGVVDYIEGYDNIKEYLG